MGEDHPRQLCRAWLDAERELKVLAFLDGEEPRYRRYAQYDAILAEGLQEVVEKRRATRFGVWLEVIDQPMQPVIRPPPDPRPWDDGPNGT